MQGRLERCKGGPEIVAETAEDIAKPSTIILSCSDSRVPPEIVCDMGLGDCHVVRYNETWQFTKISEKGSLETMDACSGHLLLSHNLQVCNGHDWNFEI